MRLGGTDLNLLVALQAVLEEGNVTRAGERLGISQPSMSAALAKLRRRFDDELLTREGRGYRLTPFAQEILPDVQETVRLMELALRVAEPFDEASSQRVFRLSMSDYAVSVLHQPLLRAIRERAPRIRLQIDPLPPEAHDGRLLIEYDAAIAPMGMNVSGSARRVWRDRMVCLVDRRNPHLEWSADGSSAPTLSLATLSTMPHARASLGPGVLTPVDRILGEIGVEARVEMSVAGWLPLCFVVRNSDLVAIVPERLARLATGQTYGQEGALVAVEPPFGDVLLVEGYWYTAERMADPGRRWLFDRLDEVAEQLALGDPG